MSVGISDFEKLGVFYLGRRHEPAKPGGSDELFLYDSRDLLTHAVCIGMTGSGKTGLCLDLIEEAAIDGVPVIAIDPKGDISDLLLTFPQLSQAEFLPWVSEEEARLASQTIDQFAHSEAERWRQGLSEWGQDGARVARLKSSAQFTIYTPGSNAGMPVSILGSLDAPPSAVVEDADSLKDRIYSTVGPLLAMLGVATDPLHSREHILLATILDKLWREGTNLTLAELIQLVQKPPVNTIGALDIESFFPAKDRFALAMSINNLMAAPGFDAWLSGAPMSVEHFLYSDAGRPKVSVFSIAHLNDSERMFFVTLLLGQVVSWMRGQSGTTSLRAILYMDEIFGYFPPVSNPPSKLPLLTLLKQARAFGIGVVLASQNPVDLDYKGLANAGTWFIGRLQTERDKMRVLDGLEGAASEAGQKLDRQEIARTLSGLSRRVFLVNNVHCDHQEIIETRWTLSYLRGPLTKTQIKKLMQTADSKEATTSGKEEPKPQHASNQGSEQTSSAAFSGSQPVIPPEIPQYYLSATTAGEVVYLPQVSGVASIHFTDPKAALDISQEKIFLVEPQEKAVSLDWSDSKEQRFTVDALKDTAPCQGTYLPPPSSATKPQNYKAWAKDLSIWLPVHQKFFLLYSPSTAQYSQPNETERAFRIRLNDAAATKRDESVEQLRRKFAPKVQALKDKIMQAQQNLEREKEQAGELDVQAAIAIGATVLGAFAGKRGLGRTTSQAARGAARAARKTQEIARAQQLVENLNQHFQELQDDFAREVSSVKAKYETSIEALQTVSFAPKKTNVQVRLVALVWTPHVKQADGTLKPAW